jgi:hypothetical protein
MGQSEQCGRRMEFSRPNTTRIDPTCRCDKGLVQFSISVSVSVGKDATKLFIWNPNWCSRRRSKMHVDLRDGNLTHVIIPHICPRFEDMPFLSCIISCNLRIRQLAPHQLCKLPQVEMHCMSLKASGQ